MILVNISISENVHRLPVSILVSFNVFRDRNSMKNLSMLKIYQCKLKLDLPLKGHSTQ